MPENRHFENVLSPTSTDASLRGSSEVLDWDSRFPSILPSAFEYSDVDDSEPSSRISEALSSSENERCCNGTCRGIEQRCRTLIYDTVWRAKHVSRTLKRFGIFRFLAGCAWVAFLITVALSAPLLLRPATEGTMVKRPRPAELTEELMSEYFETALRRVSAAHIGHVYNIENPLEIDVELRGNYFIGKNITPFICQKPDALVLTTSTISMWDEATILLKRAEAAYISGEIRCEAFPFVEGLELSQAFSDYIVSYVNKDFESDLRRELAEIYVNTTAQEQ